MSEKAIFWMGILGMALFGIASILGGFQFDDYNPVSQSSLHTKFHHPNDH